MKYFKIILAILAIIGIGIAIRAFYIKTTGLPPVDPSANQFVRRVRQEIQAIADKPNSSFCKDTYDIIKYHIDDYASINRLGATIEDIEGNKRQQQILLKDLFSAYSEKFIDQANYVFNHSAWKSSDLSFIRSEANRLRLVGNEKSYLERGVGSDKDLLKCVQNTVDYDEEVRFINECNSFSFKNKDLDKHFPITEAKRIIDDSKQHLNSLGIVKNSEVVHKALTNIPQKVFSAHVSYLAVKLEEYKEMYMYSFSLKDYENNLYGLLKKDISELDNPMYSSISGINPSVSKSQLLRKLEDDHDAAKTYWRNR